MKTTFVTIFMRLNNVRGICVYLPIQYLYKESFWSNESIQWRRLLISISILNLTFRVDDETQIVTDFSNPTGTVGLGKNFVWNKILFFYFFHFSGLVHPEDLLFQVKLKILKKFWFRGEKFKTMSWPRTDILCHFGICHILLCAGAPWSSRAERGGLNFVNPQIQISNLSNVCM